MDSRPDINNDLDSIIVELKEKASGCKKAANVYLIIIGVVIVIGLLLFAFAYRFSVNFDRAKEFNLAKEYIRYEFFALDELKESLAKKDSTIDSVFLHVYDIEFERKFLYRQILTASTLEYVDALEFIDSLSNSDLGKFVYAPNQLEKFQNHFEEYLKIRRQQLLRTNQYLDSIQRKVDVIVPLYFNTALNDFRNEFNTATFDLIDASATRVGSIVIILFLVQLLIRIFRYNTRMANYYSARSNALEMYKQFPSMEVSHLVAILSPDCIDLGISKNPTDSLVELIKNLPK